MWTPESLVRETGHENIRRTLECSGLFKTSVFFRACLNGGGGPQVGEVTRKNKTRLLAILQPRVLGWYSLRLLLRLQLRSLSRGVPSSHLEKDERLILVHICIYSWKRHALCYAVFGFARNRWLNTLYGIVWETKYGRFTTLNIPKCEHFTLLVCPLRFLVISAMRRLGNVQSFKTYMFRFWAFCHEPRPRLAGLPHLVTCTWQIVTPADRVNRPGRPGNPPRRVSPPIM